MLRKPKLKLKEEQSAGIVKTRSCTKLCMCMRDQFLNILCREGIYVRVVGHLRSFKQQRSVIVFSIRPIAHFNEITSHLMETLHGYLCLQKGPNVVGCDIACVGYCVISSNVYSLCV